MGSQGMPRRYYNYLEQFEFYHQIQPSVLILALGLFVALWSLIDSLRNGEKALQNPWNASTLEWTVCATPPIEHNFHETPHVTTGPYDFGIEEGYSDSVFHFSEANYVSEYQSRTRKIPPSGSLLHARAADRCW